MNEREIFKKGSKTFFFASLFFDAPTFKNVAWLYSVCRQLDDVADGSELGQSYQDPRLLPADRMQIVDQTAIIERLQALGCAPAWFYDLYAGMEFDVRGGRIHTESDLMLYCYQVAGTVGLMMARILGGDDLGAARDLGIALQLYNIIRDYHEDAKIGRCYIPDSWKQSPDQSLQLLMKLADARLASALRTRALSMRYTFVVHLAGRMYRRMAHAERHSKLGYVMLAVWSSMRGKFLQKE